MGPLMRQSVHDGVFDFRSLGGRAALHYRHNLHQFNHKSELHLVLPSRFM